MSKIVEIFIISLITSILIYINIVLCSSTFDVRLKVGPHTDREVYMVEFGLKTKDSGLIKMAVPVDEAFFGELKFGDELPTKFNNTPFSIEGDLGDVRIICTRKWTQPILKKQP